MLNIEWKMQLFSYLLDALHLGHQNIDGLMQDCGISTANTKGIPQSSTANTKGIHSAIRVYYTAQQYVCRRCTNSWNDPSN